MKSNRDFFVLQKKFRKMNYLLLLNILAITLVSLFTVYSATQHKTMMFFYKEIVWVIMGVGTYFVFSMIDYRMYARYSRLIYLFTIIMLSMVFIVGEVRLGARRWINLGFMTIQPSEFAKIFIVLTFSELLANRYKNNFYGLKTVVMTGIHILPIFLLIMKQPDLGTSLTLGAIFAVLIFIHGIDWKTIIILLVTGIGSIPLAYKFALKDYQRQRILTFLNPEADIQGSGWNVIQSMIAVGSGGMFGKGFLQSTQSKLRFLPESHTDFIGSVFLEEMGFVGGASLILLYAFLIMNIMAIGSNAEDEYGKLIAYGIAAIMFFHTVVNLGMIMGVMPVTGLPLLLMSYGGSSFLFTFMIMGIAQSIKVHKE